MRWEAANITKTDAREQQGHEGLSKKSTETVEAALARLTRGYSAAMNCIGSLHKLPSISDQSEKEASMQRVANAARSALERSVLIDPLVAKSLAPTWYEQVVKLASMGNDQWSFVQQDRPEPALLTSASHQSTVRELAYLSLVNYADLLVKALPMTDAQDRDGILDKGVVPYTPPLIWNGEEAEFTQRLVVAALCDASELDGSDPTMWLKLACAARRLTVLSADSGESYDRLERHALEQGRMALPPDVPPNRLIVRALAQHHEEKESCQEYPPKLRTPEEMQSLVLDLPRYSWSMLGRMLLRACREGSDFRQHFYSIDANESLTPRQQKPFGSPCIVLKLSPMLALPMEALGTICQYLDNASVWKFEATCRALSASILSARTSLERRGSLTTGAVQEQKDDMEQEQPATTDAPSSTTGNVPTGTTETVSTQQLSESNERNTLSAPSLSQQNAAASTRQTSAGTASESEEQAVRSQRTSKRVLSKRITSGKLAERKSKRNSVEFCFIATLFGCTKDDERYQNALKEEIDWDESLPANLRIRPSQDQSPTKSISLRQQRETVGIEARIGDASLTAFVKRWSAKNSGPMDILSRYLVHIATNVEQVFTVDSDSAVPLAPFVIECIDTLLKRGGSPQQGLVPSWYGTSEFGSEGNIRELLEMFSINLLNAELRLRACERVALVDSDYENDGTIVAALVPELIRVAEEIELTFPMIEQDRDWLSLKTRLHWLASNFFFWWGRVSHNVREAKDAESRGLEHIDEAMKCLKLPQDNPIASVRTPQLESPARSAQHWKVLSAETLSLFRDELQASSVVSVARERFMEEMAQIKQRVAMEGDELGNVRVNGRERERLAEIGSELFGRYDIPEDKTNRLLLEVIDDFLEIHGGDLLTIESDSKEKDLDLDAQEPWRNVWDLLPSPLPTVDKLVVPPNPSILSVLGICMHTMDGGTLSLLSLFSHLAIAGFGHLGTLLQKSTSENAVSDNTLDDGDDFSDSDDSMASDDEETEASRKEDEIKIQRYAQMIRFLIEKIRDIFEEGGDAEVSLYVSSKECLALLHCSLAFSAGWYGVIPDKTVVLRLSLDLDMLMSTQKLVRCLLDSKASDAQKRAIESTYFAGLARVLISQRHEFPSILQPSRGKRLGRALRQKVCLNRADYVSTVASEMAQMLSVARSLLVSSEGLDASFLIRGLSLSMDEDEAFNMSSSSLSRLASLAESVLWLWKYMAVSESDETHTVRLSGSSGASSFDRPIIETLYAPVASLFVGLCGSSVTTGKLSGHANTFTGDSDQMCVSEIYDSDASATELAYDDDENGNNTTRLKFNLQRRLCHAAHCMALVTGELNTKVASSYHASWNAQTARGPHLPLVVSRVSNHFADMLLSEFGSEESPGSKRKNLWEREYPVGTRSIGGLLDFVLYKAYRALHGFTLTGTDAQQAIAGMDQLAESGDDVTPSASHIVKPESTLAAAQLYRCVLRASGNARRKSPPKEALECIASALPAMEESQRSKVIRNFLFSGEDYFSYRDILALLNKDPRQIQAINAMPDWVWGAEHAPGSERHYQIQLNQEMEDAYLVRKGICHELAQGPPPTFSASSVDGTKSSKSSAINQNEKIEERVVAAGNEEELSKKFDAVLDDLCYGEPVNSKGWHDASQCLLLKADLIADRLGLSKGFARTKDFHIPTNRAVDLESKRALGELIDEQEKEFSRNSEGWVPFLGGDLSVYIRHQWASFPSLRACFDEIGKRDYARVTTTTDDDDYAAQVWREIGSLYDKEDFVGWQQAWGGLFVGALRKMALRCMYIALYLLRRETPGQTAEEFLTAEIAESIGVSFYSELMGSQMYGFPMHVMTDHRKRQLAETALACFQFAIDASETTTIDEDEETRQTWDLLFMKGKCHEKIATTYSKEAFRVRDEDEMSDEKAPTRAYERHLQQALQAYAASYEEAKIIDKDGGLGEIHGGGSTHGLTEVFYRLHASRQKCLLRAASEREGERDMAESEALRLTTAHWFHAPASPLESQDTRGRVWAVLSDVVSAMAQCRIDQAFFHRSVYRHAQALMWAPVFHDPASGMANGSLGFVPVTKGSLLRGLNSTTPCASSVQAILNPLFEKKRPQIVGVWVTNASVAQSPFELLNNSVRKYDSLRGKYISAYIDTLRLCKEKDGIETLLQSLGAAPRDLPSFFQATAMARGGAPELPHTKESLLVKGRSLVSSGFLLSAKREANSALASVLADQVSPDDTQKAQAETLKTAYACFLRLNCSVDDLRRTRAWKYGQASLPEVHALCQAFLARDDVKKVPTEETSDWIGGSQKTAVLKAALEKCQELFPNIQKDLYGKRKRSRSKTKATTTTTASGPEPPEAEAPSKKRKEPDDSSLPTTPQTFAVTVPEGLSAGDKFDTTVALGDGSNKKVRLTVPAGSVSGQKLQFSLQIPSSASSGNKSPDKS